MIYFSIIEEIEDLLWLEEGLVKPLESHVFRLTNPSLHLVIHDDVGAVIARCSLWDRLDSEGAPMAEGILGHYAATTIDDGALLLSHASELHRQKGHKRIIGPIDKSTWHRYRLVTKRGLEPMFFLEPDNPDDWPSHFSEAGFTPLSTYTSTINQNLKKVDPRSDARLKELERNGITMRTVNMVRFEEELAAIHELCLVAFKQNFLYSPIPLKEFLTLYLPIRIHIIPELVILMEHENRLIGFIFAIPNLLDPKDILSTKSVIIKTMAVHPDYGGKGIGGILMDYVQRSASKLGFDRAIAALMQEENLSRRISNHYGTTIREYTLYEMTLSG